MPSISTGISLGVVASGLGLVVGNLSGGAGYVSPHLTSNTPPEFAKSFGESCGEKYFSIKPKTLDQLPQQTDPSPIQGFFIPRSRNTKGRNTASCLVVNWKKDNYASGKWSGSFKGNGSFINGDSGLLSFNIVTLGGSTNTFSGITYLLSKVQDQGFISHQKEVSHQLSTDLGKWVPDIKRLTEEIGAQGLNTFYGNDKELKQICEPGQCTSPTTTETFEASWLWKRTRRPANSYHSVYPYLWSSNFKEGWNRTYSLAAGNLTEQMDPFVGIGRSVDFKFRITKPSI